MGIIRLPTIFYLIILLVSSYSIPSAISKEIAKALSKKEYRNVQRIFYGALFYVFIIGGLASLLTFFAAPMLAEKNSVNVLRVFAPTIFLSGLLGVFRGFFQGHNTLTQTSISQILEQILNAVISILAAFLLMNTVLLKDETTIAIYGAVGSAIGTGVGVLGAFIFMVMVYLLNKGMIKSRMKHSQNEVLESYSSILKNIFYTVTPFILSTAIYNLNIITNQTIFTKILIYIKGLTEAIVSAEYGIFAGQVVVIANIPIAIASSMSAAIIPRIAANFAINHTKEANQQISLAIRFTMLISIPAAVGIFVLAKPIILILFPLKDTVLQASSLLQCMSITIVLYSLSTLTNAVLQGIGKINLPVINASIALAIQTVVLVILLITTKWGLYTLVIASITNAFFICFLNQVAVYKNLGLLINVKLHFLIPFVASVVMGIMTKLMYFLAYNSCKSNFIATFLSIGVAVISYFILIIKLGGIEEEEMQSLPKGDMLIKIARKCKIL